jgi:two-component system, LytTR family, sensor kinase
MPGASGTSLRRLAAYFAVWTVAGVFFFSQDLSRSLYWNDPTPAWRYLATWLLAVWLFAAATPAMLWTGRRFPISRKTWLRSVPVHLAASCLFSLAHVAATSAAMPHLRVLGMLTPRDYASAVALMLVLGFHGNLLSYWTVIGVQHVLRVYRRSQERQKTALRLEAQAQALTAQLSRAQLSALKAQLQPHFLFNTLNAIMVLVRQREVELAEETIGRLSNLLRFVLDDASAHEVSLRRELDYLELYLSIEQLRFADRLRVELVPEEGTLGAALPHMGLQPLVENAVRHGIGARASAGLLRVRARRRADARGDVLVIDVEDDGPGPAEQQANDGGEPKRSGGGIGLSNTRARLQQLYGEGASLTLAARSGGGAVATMVVPFHLASELPS